MHMSVCVQLALKLLIKLNLRLGQGRGWGTYLIDFFTHVFQNM